MFVSWETKPVRKTCELILDISRGTALLCRYVITIYDYVARHM